MNVNSASISRRSAVIGTASGLFLASLTHFGSDDALASENVESISWLITEDLVYFPTTAGQVLETPRVLGGLFNLVGKDAPQGSIFSITWDSRLYELGSPTLWHGDREIAIHPAPVAFDGDGIGKLNITVEESLPQGTYDFTLGNARTLEYPDDIVDQPVQTTLTLQGALSVEGDNTAVMQQQLLSDETVWGGVMGASWLPLEWGDGFYVWRPDLLTLRSVGPAPIPAGALIQVQLDSEFFSELSISSEVYDVHGSSQELFGTLRVVTWALPDALPAGERLRLELSAKFTPKDKQVELVQPSTVSLNSDAASLGQRTTGGETLSRIDHVYSGETKALSPLNLLPNLRN